jgi:hypothetical protein
MIINDAYEEPSDEHEAGFPCPACNVITIRQPFASFIALGFKHDEFRSQPRYYEGPVLIHAGKNWYTPEVREIVTMHFRKYARHHEEAIQALFPIARPVAEAVVQDCKPWSEINGKQYYALRLTQVRIITRPKPAFNGMQSILFKTAHTRELAVALSGARVLEGPEKDAVYQEFELLALRSKLNTWLKSKGLGAFALTHSR